MATASRFPSDPGEDDSSDDQMPDYAKNIIVEDHYIKITQQTQNTIKVEEIIWYKNEGTDNYTGKIYTWAPGINEITQFDAVIDEKPIHLRVYPSVNFLVTDLEDNNISVKSNETLEIIFVYSVEYPSVDKFDFSKTFLYNNSNIIIIIDPNNNFKIEGKEGLTLIYEPNTKTYVTEHPQVLSKELGEMITVSFSKTQVQNGGEDSNSKSGFKLNDMLIAIIIISIVIVITIITLVIKFLTHEKSEDTQKLEARGTKPKKPRASAKTRELVSKTTTTRPARSTKKEKGKEKEKQKPERKALIHEKKKILKTTDRIKSDYKDGTISKETFENLKTDYKKKLKTINKKIARIDKDQELDEIDEEEIKHESPELKKLMNKKEKILKAIKKLEEDKEAGVLDEDLFDEMSAAYKKQAIEILQKIDQVREKNS
jgi:hypothetical protein